MTQWQWVTISPDIRLQLSLDSDDPEVIARVEESARANGIVLKRIAQPTAEEVGQPPRSAEESV